MRAFTILGFLLTFASLSIGQLGKDLGDVSRVRGGSSTDAEIIAGQKEVLSLCIADAVRAAAVENGFWSNETIKIRMPSAMQASERDLRLMGQGLRIDDFELSMNRAAEAAAPSVGPLLSKAIADLTFTDPRGVLNGGSSADIEYLEKNSNAQLTKSLRPIVQAAMNKADVPQNYQYVVAQMRGVTLGKEFQFDITGYVVAKTLDGILQTAGAQEKQIRANPQAQESPVVKQVFASH